MRTIHTGRPRSASASTQNIPILASYVDMLCDLIISTLGDVGHILSYSRSLFVCLCERDTSLVDTLGRMLTILWFASFLVVTLADRRWCDGQIVPHRRTEVALCLGRSEMLASINVMETMFAEANG